MSLRGFHFVFITASITVAFGFAYFEALAYRMGGAGVDLVIAGLASGAGLTLVGYEIWFFKKSRKLNL
jgi:hypothetical protein